MSARQVVWSIAWATDMRRSGATVVCVPQLIFFWRTPEPDRSEVGQRSREKFFVYTPLADGGQGWPVDYSIIVPNGSLQITAREKCTEPITSERIVYWTVNFRMVEHAVWGWAHMRRSDSGGTYLNPWVRERYSRKNAPADLSLALTGLNTFRRHYSVSCELTLSRNCSLLWVKARLLRMFSFVLYELTCIRC